MLQYYIVYFMSWHSSGYMGDTVAARMMHPNLLPMKPNESYWIPPGMLELD